MATKFNENFKKLEEIVTKLETNDLDLDEAIELYEQGVKISEKLEKELNKVSERLESDVYE